MSHPSSIHADERTWSTMSDELLQGLAHAFGNRVFALGAVRDALRDEPGADAELLGALGDEVARLDGCLRALRLLTPDHRPPEPVHFLALLDDIGILQAFHHELRDVPCERSVDGEIPPVLARRATLARLLMLLVGAARRAAASSGTAAVLRCSSDETSVRLEVSPTGAPMPDAESDVEAMARAAAFLAPQLDGVLVLTGNGDGWTLTLPTLAAARRREREAPAAG
jgi:signal transduction histidine kinase